MLSAEFEPIDRHLAAFLERLSCGSDSVRLAALLVSRATRQGHICMDLAEWAGRPVSAVGVCPDLETWRQELLSCGLAGEGTDGRPLVLDKSGRLYLARYYAYEQDLARRLLALYEGTTPELDKAMARAGLARLFPLHDGEINWQAVAACAALARGLTIIVGGPGTGKTTTVAKILALILEQAPEARLALAAPTGKAAYRLQVAVAEAAEQLDIPAVIRTRLPAPAATIHRLLGSRLNSPTFRHNALNPLPYDLVVVDEASMVDLALMDKLVAALKPEARLILLGDKDQLASVQAGHVLGDLCRPAVGPYSDAFAAFVRDLTGMVVPAASANGLRDAVVELTHTYRFTPASGIAALGRAVNMGQDCGFLLATAHTDLAHYSLPAPAQLKEDLARILVPHYQAAPPATDIPARLAALKKLGILAAVKEGPYGVTRLNAMVEDILSEARLIRPDRQFYRGRPVMITTNDYAIRLFNGDMGVILKDPDDGRLYAWFETPDGLPRRVSPARLPAHETAYAMTVHKSQGSEFGHVLLVLPDRENPVLTREIVYTGITRARNRLDLWTDPAILQSAVNHRIERTSGLRDALWGEHLCLVLSGGM